jgi:hypothetical protein
MKNNKIAFRTVTPQAQFPFKINYSKKSAFVGSCFTEHIGRRTECLKFPVLVNPFGILYNPVSVKNAVNRIILGLDFTEQDLIYHKGLWHSMMHHGDYSSPDQAECLKKINDSIKNAEAFLQKADVLFITFGTAWLYEYKATGETVGNCHKLPADAFNKRLLNADEITIEFYQLLNDLQNYNPNLEIVLSVSPVRYLKDGFYENTISKAILSVAIHQISERFDNVHYFPSYELLQDDLRDYRFYADDLIHPSDKAVDYIFRYFSDVFFDSSAKQRSEEIEQIVRASRHRIIHPGTGENRLFAQNILKKIEAQAAKKPTLDFSAEEKHFNDLLAD